MGSLGGTRLYTVAVACLYLSGENVIFSEYSESIVKCDKF